MRGPGSELRWGSAPAVVLGLLGAVVLYPSDAPDFVDDPQKIAVE